MQNDPSLTLGDRSNFTLLFGEHLIAVATEVYENLSAKSGFPPAQSGASCNWLLAAERIDRLPGKPWKREISLLVFSACSSHGFDDASALFSTTTDCSRITTA